FYDPPAGRIVAHTDWSPSGTMFDYRASWISINHQDGASGEFGLFRKGEFLTKELSNYDNTNGGNGETTTFHNTLSLQNWCTACSTINWQGVDLPAWQHGSQWMEGVNAGDPINSMSSGPGYVFANSDLTNLYNKPNVWTPANSVVDVTQATRSIFWLNADYIVVYDRATTNQTGLFKQFSLSLVAPPAINGHTVKDTLPSGQQLFLQTLLPQNVTYSSFNGASQMQPLADQEPMAFILTAQDPSNPSNTRFLNVLQGADAGAQMVAASYLQSASGTAFDGTAFGSTVVYFPVNANPALASTALPAPAGTHTAYIAGLVPNTGYNASVNGGVISLSPNGQSMADAAGVLRLTY
ncbi:MAG: hypothetical protein HYR64_01665, partial [Fimbriimonas ginsengisoli]|nr:hypothetical protein [Fimbriimonas ginsengisoli]